MSLSDFGYDILVALDDADGPLTVDEIANRLSNEKHGRISVGITGIHLEHALDKYVEKTSEGKWKIASPHHGKFSPTKQPVSEAEENIERNEEEQETLDELGQLIVRLLADSDEPMLTREIANEISKGAHGVVTTDVNRRLYNSLSGLVEPDLKHRWGLVNKDYDERADDEASGLVETDRTERTEDSDEEHEEGPEGDEAEDSKNAQEKRSATKEEPTEADSLKSFSPSGRAGEIGARLETAKQIAFLLDLTPQPLEVGRLAELLGACGREVAESTVRECLDTTLEPFIRREDSGYCLEDESETAIQVPTDKSPNGEETSGSDTEDTPIDAVTRASVAGRRYNYVFETHELDSLSLFSSQIRGGTVEIQLNTSHFAFDRLEHVLDGELASDDRSATDQPRNFVRLLIVAWTEVEGDLTGRRSELAEEIRDDWGRALRFLLRERKEQ
jgi:hypothetical protein